MPDSPRSAHAALPPQPPGIIFDVSIADPVARIQAFMDAYQARTGPNPDLPPTFETSLLTEHLKIASVDFHPSGKTCTANFTMLTPQAFCNGQGQLHGGAASMIVDMATTMAQAPLARAGYWEFGGVSRTLSCTLLRPVGKGMEVDVVAEVIQVGKALVTIQCRIQRKVDGVVCITGEHNKAFVDMSIRPRI